MKVADLSAGVSQACGAACSTLAARLLSSSSSSGHTPAGSGSVPPTSPAALEGMQHPERFKVCLKSIPSSQREHRSSRFPPASAAPPTPLRPRLLVRLHSLRALRLPKQKQIPKTELVSSSAEGRGTAGGGEGAGRRKGKASGEVGGGREGLVSKPNSWSVPVEQISSVYFISLVEPL